MFKRTTAVNKILKLKKRKRVVYGGSSAGKTFAIIPILIDQCIKKAQLEVSIVSESIPHLKKGALKDFIKIMKSTGRWNENNYNATDRKYVFFNGSFIEFFSPESVLGSRRDVLYITECNRIQYEDYIQLAMRTSKYIYLDYNPASEFWVDTELAKEDDVDFLLLTYKDNEARPENVDADFKNFIKKAEEENKRGLPITSYWQNYVRVYVHGLRGNVKGLVFNNWHTIKEVPKEAEFIGYGQDFGFSSDPTAIVCVWKKDEVLYVNEIYYELGKTNSDVIKDLQKLGVSKIHTIVQDSAEPKSIEDYKRAGYKVQGARKGTDSIRKSIDTLQAFTIYVTEDSTNLIKELRTYAWKLDNSEKQTNEVVDHMNHAIDALRYVALNLINRPKWAMY